MSITMLKSWGSNWSNIRVSETGKYDEQTYSASSFHLPIQQHTRAHSRRRMRTRDDLISQWRGSSAGPTCRRPIRFNYESTRLTLVAAALQRGTNASRLSRDAPIYIRLRRDAIQHACMSALPPVLANIECASCPAVVPAVIYSRMRPKRRIIKGIPREGEWWRERALQCFSFTWL